MSWRRWQPGIISMCGCIYTQVVRCQLVPCFRVLLDYDPFGNKPLSCCSFCRNNCHEAMQLCRDCEDISLAHYPAKIAEVGDIIISSLYGAKSKPSQESEARLALSLIRVPSL
ncbi:hypothetical protein BDP55DRAFT_297650 [Colletotrichum godetiae]|uniref:Uncharacterized protein n=1 Tax=Colletotrichum godetiae TaxID=1209918 RepID=A0AAJ0AC27_9PEZI|nr:uncharacterized protein BDP55DRAFT_297650 [Colletotrichum godetiae]KAK1671160.1 hypothetical protein BDP55DRAFT_297650 [Colletotrichum godetiae]